MEKRRVLLLCAQPLLGEGLEAILGNLEDVELISSLWATDAHLLARLCEDEPDILLVAEGKEDANVTSLVARILKQYPNLPVIRIELAHNAVHLYTSRTLPARSVDLIKAIRNLPVRQ